MRIASLVAFVLVAACGGGAPPVEKSGASAPAAEEKPEEVPRSEWQFERDEVGAAPGFFSLEEGAGAGTPAVWKVVEDDFSPANKRVLAITDNKNPKTVYHLALVKGFWGDLDASVMVRAVAGTNNQGGGIAFRAKGANDHYVARWNPLENNVRLYAVIDGGRIDIVAKEVLVEREGWHALRVIAEGASIQVFLDDQPVLSAQDKTFTEGQVGLWAKGDADTRFDDFSVASP